MRKFVRFGLYALLSAFIGVVFSGCVAPFSPNNTSVRFEGGKPYAIPYGAPYRDPRPDIVSVSLIQQACGDPRYLLWVEEKTYQKWKTNSNRGDLVAYVKPLFSQKLAGCVAPMSDQELQYTMHQQGLQQQRDIAESQQWQQSMQQMQQQTQNQMHNLQMQQLNNNLQRLYQQRQWGF